MNLLLMNSESPPLVKGEFISGRLPLSMWFSRSSSGTRLNSAAVLESAGVNEARFGISAPTMKLPNLIVETQQTNILPFSRRVSQWYGTTSTVTDDQYVSPDGTTNASQIVTTAAYQGKNFVVYGAQPNTSYAVSGFAKVFSGSTILRLGIVESQNTTNNYIHLDASAGTATSQGTGSYNVTIMPFPNGWFYFCYYVTLGSSQSTLTALATTPSGGSTFSVWGAQIECGTKATSYIPTNGSAVTRATDIVGFTIPVGVKALRYTFDDNSVQDLVVSPGPYTIPGATINRSMVKRIVSI